MSAADRIELTVAPWSAYVVLPLFAFSATGVHFAIDLSQAGADRILAGILVGLVIGKPLGISLATWLAIKSRLAVAPEGVTLHQFIGAACLCGVADTVALLMVDRVLPGPHSAIAKIGILVASMIAAVLGSLVLVTGSNGVARSPVTD